MIGLRVVLAPMLGLFGLGCVSGYQAAVPSSFVRQAEPHVTLTTLKQHPEAYRGKMVILGGVIVDKREEQGRVWLLVKNRPLDEDFVPHVPPSLDGPEAGFYWVALTPQGLSKAYHGWARITVVGRVSEETHPHVAGVLGADTVLLGLYMRGWGMGWGGYGTHEEAWEDTQSASSIMTAPKTILRTGQGQ
jgi:starvation-inducible outer membrane lipoprotein